MVEMAGGLVASIVASHSPRMGVEENAPEFIKGLIDGLRELGQTLRTLEPDAIVLHSAHWVSTFWWYVPGHEIHEGICVADEAPDLIPGSPYRWPGEPALAKAIADRLNANGIDCRTFDTPHWNWEYGSYVPLHYLDPASSVPVVLLPTVLCSNLEENRKVGRLVHDVGKDTGKKTCSSPAAHFRMMSCGAPSVGRPRSARASIASSSTLRLRVASLS